MCGIIGFFDDKYEVLKNFNELISTLQRRGPNDQGTWSSNDKKIILGHTRLSVLDLSSNGKQPMISHDERFVMVYNGEIYNHIVLKEKISLKRKTLFRSTSDTEILLESLSVLGLESTLNEIDGMFAFCVFDRKKNEMILARDRFGEKPLYFGNIDSKFFFSSDLSFLKKMNKKNLILNKDSVRLLLKYSYIPSPFSIYKNIYKLKPGNFLRIKISDLLKKRFPSPSEFQKYSDKKTLDSNILNNNIEDNVEILETLIEKSVKERIVSDVPVGSFLSGGIDSSLITAIMQKVSDNSIETFSIGQSDSRYNELTFAKKISLHLKTKHNEFEINDNDMLNTVDRLNQVYSEPFADSSQIPSILLSEKVKLKVSVALTGDAGDELFGGYNRYLYSNKILKYFDFIPFKLRSKFANILQKTKFKKINFLGFILKNFSDISVTNLSDKTDKLLEKLTYIRNDKDLFISLLSQWKNNDEIFYNEEVKNDVVKEHFYNLEDKDNIITRMMLSDLRYYLPDDILCKIDRAAMHFGLETRVPFLSREIYNFSKLLPLDQKIQGKEGKIILRKILEKYIPNDQINRPKMGFAIPIDQYLRNPLKQWSYELILKKELYEEFFCPNIVMDIWKKHQSGKYDYQTKLWPILSFISWRNFNS
jgi:asparagine synthase (glutamine-hydrolysing)